MRLYPLKLIPDNTNIQFMELKNINFGISIALIILSFVLLFTKGLNMGIDFSGGIMIEARTSQKIDLAPLREKLGALNIGEISIQNFGSDEDIAIRVGSSGDESEIMKNIDLIKSVIEKNIGNSTVEYRKVDFVGPQVGSQLIYAGAQAVLLSFLGILIYIWVRFEWHFGLGIVLSLIHDVIMALGFMSLTGLDFNLSSVAAILTIIGYSVNDSVVIYDRIRENLRKYHNKSLHFILNASINETLSRTTLTVGTTLIANLALIIYGGEAIKSFSIMMFVGILAGSYSSIYVAAPLLTVIGFKRSSAVEA